MTFGNPQFFALYLIIPFLVFIYLFKAKRSHLDIVIADKEKSFSNVLDVIGFHFPFAMRILVIALLIFVLARPQLGKSFSENKHLGLDIFFAVDTSQSMSALDLEIDGQRVDRLMVLKKILNDFVLKREKDRLGLIVFGEEAFTQCPLTMDHGAIVDLIDHLRIGMAGNATAIGSAIGLGVKRLKNLEAKSKILILMTDGMNTAGSIAPQAAGELAKQLGIKVYTIGIGQDGEVPFVVDTPIGPQTVMQAIEIDEELLIEIAESTGGQYFRARNTEELRKIYDHIDKLEKTEIKIKEYNSFVDIYENFLWAALIVFLLEIFIGNTWFYRLT